MMKFRNVLERAGTGGINEEKWGTSGINEEKCEINQDIVGKNR